ncbi:DUF2846 domain-containing protein (plasmid) [Paraburkholderia sp. PREW-6R]|uniref:DUF2846 domain-containing protein n=1 Tax=Paraburkholderia sp. PREW-6R TaxID=3141544 RepID=UPI0031F4BC72
MTKIYRAVLLSTCTALLAAGCASGPQFREMDASGIPTLQPNHGRVYFFRESSFLGAGVSPLINIDGVAVGRSVTGQYFYVDEPAGEHTVSVRTEAENTLTLSLAAGETKYVRTTVTPGFIVGHVRPFVETPEAAAGHMKSLKYVGRQ